MLSVQRIIGARPSKKPVKQYTLHELEALREDHAQQFSAECVAHKKKTRSESAIGRSGILPKYQNCTFKNFVADTAEKASVVNRVREWLKGQLEQHHSGGFVFAGTTGTGKNHLASAIANVYISKNKTAVVITISDLMIRLRETYNDDSADTEMALIKKLSEVDLLVLDEVGVQRNTNNEQVTLSTIINNRDALNKPTGVLTNLGYQDLVKTLGERAMDRIMTQGIWSVFNWESFRASIGVQHDAA